MDREWYVVRVQSGREDTIKDNLGEVRPTLMAGVPRVFEKFYAAVVEKGTSAEGMKLKMFNKAMELSAKHGELEAGGRKLGLIESAEFGMLKKAVFASSNLPCKLSACP